MEWPGLKRLRLRLVLAALAGGLVTVSLPPAGLAPVLWIALPLLIWLIDASPSAGSAFLVGWVFGFSHFFTGLYWIAGVLFIDIARFWWVLPFAAGGLPLALALFTGAVTVILYQSRAYGLARVLLFAALWSAAEYLRGHIFTGFPWNLTGYVWASWPEMRQSAAWIGSYGLGLLTVLAAALPSLLGKREIPALSAKLAVGAGLGLMGALWLAGFLRLVTASAGGDAAVVPVRLLQPAIGGFYSPDAARIRKAWDTVVSLSTEPPPKPGTIIVWPESTLPLLILNEPAILSMIGEATPEGGLTLAASLRVEPGTPSTPARFFNSLVAINREGSVLAIYDKAHLVPFGEYFPLQRFLPGGVKAMLSAGSNTGFSAGEGPVSWVFPGLPVLSPLICYEAIFPSAVTGMGVRPALLVNVTNDGWYGYTTGPFQHFDSTRMRAVEEGIPLARAALTGISGLFDAYGRVVASLPLGVQGVVDAVVPPATSEPTFYGRYGDLIFAGLLLMLILPFPFFRTVPPRPSR